MLIAGLRLGTPEEVVDGAWVTTAGPSVVGIGQGPPPGRPDVDLDGALVVPGFVDLHCHGGGGGSFDAGAEEAARAAAFHRAHGTTTTVASLVSASPADLHHQVRELVDVVRDGTLAAIHLEGPWISARRCGAHDPETLRDPTRAELLSLLDAAQGTLAMVTLAPERPGALDALRLLGEAGIVGAVGHTEATYEVTVAAIDAGARVATHLANAMPPPHHRRPGPVVALLDDPRVVCELVDDGHHLHPAFVTHVARHVGPGRLALVTDAMVAAGLGDGRHHLGTIPVDVADGRATVVGTEVLAGSTLTMDTAFRRAVRVDGLTVPRAVAAASTTPARVLGRQDVGRLGPGGRADLVVLDDDLVPTAVMAGGTWVAGAP